MEKNIAIQADQAIQNAYGRKIKNAEKKQFSLEYSLRDLINLEKYKIRLFNGLYSFWANKRLRWGMILLMIIAPLIKFAYVPFPIEGFGDYFLNTKYIQIHNTLEGPNSGWYWGLVRMYIFSNGELLAPVISILGIFFLFPQKYYPSYLVGVPFGYYAGLSFHRLFFVNSLSDFHSSWPLSITLMFIILGVVAFMISDKILFQENHRKNATEARILGLIDMPGVPWSEKEDLLKKEAKDLKRVSNILYEKSKSA